MRRLVRKITILALLLSGLSTNLTVKKSYAAPNTQVFFEVVGGEVVISASITTYGPGSSETFAANAQKWINETWNNAANQFTANSCYPMRFDVTVTHADTDSRSDIPAGNEAWFVVQVEPGQFHRSSVRLPDNYIADGIGTMDSNDGAYTLAHEAGHVFGLGDKYDYTTEDPLPGWEGNIMAEPGGTPDARNFQEILEAAHAALGALAELPPCLRARLSIEVSGLEPSFCNLDDGSAEMEFAINPVAYDGAGSLTGSGEGNTSFTPVSRCPDTQYGGIETPDPYPVTVFGMLTNAGYELALLADDLTITFFTSGEVYSENALLPFLFEHSTGVNTDGSLESFTIPRGVQKGDTFEFTIGTPPETGYWWEGVATLEIIATPSEPE